jgi:hypothetical protein
MRTREELVALIDASLPGLGALPLSRDWMDSAIRHCQRNMDFDFEAGVDGTDYKDGNEPERYAGTPMAELLNAIPEIRAQLAAASPTGGKE